MTAPQPGLITRLGPTGLAAVAAGVLVLFGLSAVIIPALANGGGASNADKTALPAAAPADTAPPSAAPTTDAAPASATPAAPATTLVAASFDTGYEDRVVQLINGQRRKQKCEPLRVDGRLRAAARSHAADMAARDYTGSRGSDGSDAAGRVRAAGFPAFAGELTAKGGDPGEVVKRWTRDDGTQATILDCGVTSIGVGAAMRGRTAYWTVDTGRA